MGYLFTLLYLFIAYLTPSMLFGSLADYHIEVVVVFLALIFSIPNLPDSKVLFSPQMTAVLGMSFAVFMSIALTGWVGGAFTNLYGFLQIAVGFWLVAVNCRRRGHLIGIVLTMFFSSIFFVVLGIRDLHDNIVPSVYLYGDGVLRRIRGLGFVNDPNDFAQVMVSLVPMTFLWKQKSAFTNVFVLGVPITMLVIGIFFTHSRGAAVALMVMVLITARRKIGIIPATILAGSLFALSLAVGWSGGRDVSAEAGSDRLDLWAAGLEMIKSHPLFGGGIGSFADSSGMTAHNSVVICAADTGIIGLFFWTMLLFSTFRYGLRFGKASRGGDLIEAGPNDSSGLSVEDLKAEKRSSSLRPSPGITFPAKVSIPPRPPAGIASSVKLDMHHLSVPGAKVVSLEEVNTMTRIVVTSLAGFLTAGWFLSRAYSLWLFMYCGMMYAVCRMGMDAGLTPAGDPKRLTLGWSVITTFVLLAAVYLAVRFRP
jgi:O-antigen ligase